MEKTLAVTEALDLINNQFPFAVEGEYLDKQRRKAVREGELGLMLAILEDAINCYAKYASARDRRGKQQFKEAEEWIFQHGSDWLFSYESICEILGIDPEYLRQGLLCWKENIQKEMHKRAGLSHASERLHANNQINVSRPPKGRRPKATCACLPSHKQVCLWHALRAWPINENRNPGPTQAFRSDAAENRSL